MREGREKDETRVEKKSDQEMGGRSNRVSLSLSLPLFLSSELGWEKKRREEI